MKKTPIMDASRTFLLARVLEETTTEQVLGKSKK